MLTKKRKNMHTQQAHKLWNAYKLSVWMILLFSVIVTLVCFFVNYLAAYEDVGKRVALTHNNAVEKIDSYLKDVKALTLLPITNFDSFKEFNRPLREREDILLMQNASSIAFNIMYTKKDVTSVFLFNKLGEHYETIRGGSMRGTYAPQDTAWFKETLALQGTPLVLDCNHLPNITLRSNEYSFSVARKVYNFNEPEEYGVILINTGFSFFNNVFSLNKLHPDERLYILNSKTESVVFSEYSEDIAKAYADIAQPCENALFQLVKIDGKYYIPYLVQCEQANWKIVSAVPVLYIMKLAMRTALINLPFLLFFDVLTVVIALISRRYVFAPLKKLTDFTILRGHGEQLEICYNRKDEIGELAKSISDSFTRVEQMNERENRLLRQMNEQELRILQKQINPHFLYNTLESIRMLALAKDEQEIADVTYSLGVVTRYSVSRSNQLVTLQEDLEIVKQYMNIQRMCYGERFVTCFAVEPEVEKLSILKFLIQPIVENAIIHGVQNISSGGIIRLTATTCGDLINIAVQDNGEGIDRDLLAEINAVLSNGGESESIGLFNVNNRIKLFYGAQYGLRIESVKGQGTSAMICIPKIE